MRWEGVIIIVVIVVIVVIVLITSCTIQTNEIKQALQNITSELPQAREPSEQEITQIKGLCNDVCTANKYSTQYRVFYNYSSESFTCQCTDNTGFVEASRDLVYSPSLEGPLRWGELPITYSVDEKSCGSYETRKIERGFNEIKNVTKGTVRFVKVAVNGNIGITCSFLENCYQQITDIDREAGIITRSESICAHKAGEAQITEKYGNIIKKAKIEMIGLAGFAESGKPGTSGFYIGSCGHPTTEIHEILHTFGYQHQNDTKSIMYYKGDSISYTLQKEGACLNSTKIIDPDIVKELMEVYS